MGAEVVTGTGVELTRDKSESTKARRLFSPPAGLWPTKAQAPSTLLASSRRMPGRRHQVIRSSYTWIAVGWLGWFSGECKGDMGNKLFQRNEYRTYHIHGNSLIT